MKSSGVKRPTHRCARGLALLLATALVVVNGISNSSITAQADAGDALKDKYTGFEGIEIDWKYGSSDETSDYAGYLKTHADVAKGTSTIEIPLTGISSEDGKLKTEEYEGRTAIFSGKAWV